MKKITGLLTIACAVAILSSCSITSRSMRTSPELLLLNMEDFELSEQLESEAQVVRILGVDWQRLFRWESGAINQTLHEGSSLPGMNLSASGAGEEFNLAYNVVSSIPVLGTVIKGNTASYALNNLMRDNPGYDVILYPQYYRVIKGVPFFYTKTQVKVRARLAKLEGK